MRCYPLSSILYPRLEPEKQKIPDRAFTQGLGLVFQVVGVTLFLTMMCTCCASSLLSKDYATHTNLTEISFHGYTAQRALTISLFAGVFFGIALAGIGLGLQAENRKAPLLAVALTLIATLFWLLQLLVAASAAHSILFTLLAISLMLGFAILLALSLASASEMHRNPPPTGHEILPADYKIPYSHYHDDPPEVRLAKEVEERKQRLAVQQKELEALEEKIKRSLGDKQ